MPADPAVTVSKQDQLTPTHDKQGIEVAICHITWFEQQKKYKIANSPTRTSALEFSGADLNYFVRVLYAEASGTAQLTDIKERKKEKEAIINVCYFRLNRRGYPNNIYVAKTFKQVCDAPGQFESSFASSPKYLNSSIEKFETLSSKECADLEESADAIRDFLAAGPNKEYIYDNFRGYNPGARGTQIGRTRFWLSPIGKGLSDATP